MSSSIARMKRAVSSPMLSLFSIAQPALHDVEGHHHPRVPEVAVVVDGDAADIHAHFARAQRHEVLLVPDKAVVDAKQVVNRRGLV
jgi:hypothetical protein